jgi:hypothetical protein
MSSQLSNVGLNILFFQQFFSTFIPIFLSIFPSTNAQAWMHKYECNDTPRKGTKSLMV